MATIADFKNLILLVFILAVAVACEKVKYGTEETPILSAHQALCGVNRVNSTNSSSVNITSPSRDQYVRNPVLLEGTCSSGLSVNLSGGGLPAPVTVSCVGGQFSQMITFTAGDGLKDLVATQAGETEQLKFCAYVDMTPPVVVITTPAAGSIVNGTTTVGGVCETGFDVRLSGNLSAPVVTSCNGGRFTAGVSLDAVDGTRTINAEQTDNVGNTGNTQSTVVRDTTAPIVTIASPAAGTAGQTGLTIGGACTNGLPVTISGPGVVGMGTTACTAGAWSTPITFSNGDGVKTVAATQRDAAGNTGQAQRDFLRDTTAPVLAITAPAAGTATVATIALVGTCTSGLNVAITGQIATPVNVMCAAGAFSATVTLVAPDGAKNVVATQTDAVGNSASDTRSFTLDTLAPAVAFSNPAANSFVAASFTVSGTCTAGINVQLSGAGLLTPVSAGCAAGTFSTNISATAGDGNKLVVATQTDAAGNTGTASRTFVRDTAGPAIAITGPAAGTATTSTIALVGSCTTGLNVTVTGQVLVPVTTACPAGTFAATVALTPPDGAKNLTATQTDAAGNSASDTRSFTLDTLAPTVAFSNPAANSFVAASFTVNGTCTAGVNVQLSGAGLLTPVSAGCAAGTFSTNISVTAGDGNKLVVATQTDAAGNTGTASRTFVRDTSGPAVAFTNPAAGAFVAATFAVSGTCTTGLDVQLAGAGLLAPVTTTCPAGTFTSNVTVTAGDGGKLVTATQTDAAGNAGTDSRTFQRDTTAPALAITGPASGTSTISTINLTGTCTTGLTVNVTGQLAAPVNTTCPAGTFSVTVTLATPDGAKAVTAAQTDAAGNTGSDTESFTLDTTAPVVAFTNPAANSFVAASFTVNGTCTTGINVQLAGAGLQAPVTTACTAGAFSSNVTVTGGDGNKLVTATQTDAAGNAGSDTRTFVRDTTGPAVTIASPAAGATITQAFTLTGACQANLALNITGDLTAPVTAMCPAGGTYSVNLNATPASGVKNVTAAQTDAAGNAGSASRAFNLQTATNAAETFTADASEGKVDILFIDDNSASMEFEQRMLGARFPSFVTELAGLNWQVGITTTDCSAGPYGICGSLLPMVGTASPILSSAVTGYDAVFRNTIERPETVDCVARGLCPSGLEEALRAANTAMTKRNAENAGFFRDGAALALVILTDEDEGSDAPVTATTPAQVVAHFNSIWAATKKFKSYAITALPGDAACLAAQQAQQGGIGFYGTYAVGLAQLTGGRSVSICAPDYSATLKQIGEDLRTVTSAVKLTRVPIASSVAVTFTPTQNITFSVRGDTVLFNQPVPAGTRIDVSYQY